MFDAVVTVTLCKTGTKKLSFKLLFIFHFNYSSCSSKKTCKTRLSVLYELACSCFQELLALVYLKYLDHPALRKNNCMTWSCQADASFFIAALYFPLISLGNGTKAGQGTWPSISHMHSRRWYFLGPKVAGCDSFFFSLSSFSSVSLEREICLLQSEAWMATVPLPSLDPVYQKDGFTVPSLWT